MSDTVAGCRTALVTGASSGIGTAFAEHLARAGCDLILVARSADRLEALAVRLRTDYGCRVEAIPMDLSTDAPGVALAAAVASRRLEVDLLVNNAGIGSAGAFVSVDAERERHMIAVNASAVVDLCHAFVPGMLARGRGAVINVASLVALQPLPYMSVYAATKAFVLSFSLGLWGEVQGRGVRVLAVCPGPVDTPFFDATGKSGLREIAPAVLMLDAKTVVEESLRALRRGRTVLVPGAINRLTAAAERLIPRAWLLHLSARAMRRTR